jgi:hypothetical protein
MTWQPPSVQTLDLNPERAALALLAASLSVARNTLLALHPQLPLTQTTDPCAAPTTLLAEVVIAHLEALAGSLERYLAVSPHDPNDDDFDF